MSTENNIPQQETTESAKKGDCRVGPLRGKEDVMREKNFCTQVSKSFLFLHKDDPKRIPDTIHSACKARLERIKVPGELCPFLKFAAHAYSASLVQIYLYDVIVRIQQIRDKLGKVELIDVQAEKNAPEIMKGQFQVWPYISKLISEIGEFNRLMSAWSKNTDSREYFHILRINQKIEGLWTKGKEWEEIEKLAELDEVDKWGDNCSLVLSMLTLQKALVKYRNARKQGLLDQEREIYDSFIQMAIQHFNTVLEELGKISVHIKEAHEEAYVDKFSQTKFPIPDAGVIHQAFDERVLGIVKDTLMWDPVPA